MPNKADAKIVLLGKENSGKTCLVERYRSGRFKKDGTCTIGAAFGTKEEIIDEKSVTLQIWDTAGSEKYDAMSRMYYRGAMAAIICYDLTEASSFDKVKFWVKELRKHEQNCKILLCGTKLDLIKNDKETRGVDYHSINVYVTEIDAKVFETSSKTGENVDELFHEVAKTCLTCLENTIENNPKFMTLSQREIQSFKLWEPQKRTRCLCRRYKL